MGAMAATPVRAQLPNWIQQPAAPLPPPVDYLAVARKQLAMQARNIPQTDRVGVVDFGLPSSRPRFALVDMVAGRIEMFPVTHGRSEEHTSELQSLMRLSYAVFCLKKNNTIYSPINMISCIS